MIPLPPIPRVPSMLLASHHRPPQILPLQPAFHGGGLSPRRNPSRQWDGYVHVAPQRRHPSFARPLRGRRDAADKLLPLVYDELRDLAARCPRRTPRPHPRPHRAGPRGVPAWWTGARLGEPGPLPRHRRAGHAPDPGRSRPAPATQARRRAGHARRGVARRPVAGPARARRRPRPARRLDERQGRWSSSASSAGSPSRRPPPPSASRPPR